MKFISLKNCAWILTFFSLSMPLSAMQQSAGRERTPLSSNSSEQSEDESPDQQLALEKQSGHDAAAQTDPSLGKIEMKCDELPHHRKPKALQGNNLMMMTIVAANAHRSAVAYASSKASLQRDRHHQHCSEKDDGNSAHNTEASCLAGHKSLAKVVASRNHDINSSCACDDDAD